ncbi:hypothetical protein IFM12276_29930 [Nocardia sputorum]|uniref:Uncharacterized protein n=1 Tax=Nocardia sputorum TaxID=2984338 RepID=A0ABM8CY88_9NOCA|nr:hypothetical protein IFM12276_29930 [Nocardia sputorum]
MPVRSRAGLGTRFSHRGHLRGRNQLKDNGFELVRVDRHIVAGTLLAGAALMSAAPAQTQAHSHHITHPGPCGKAPGVLQNLQPKSEPAEIKLSRRAGVSAAGASRGMTNRP